MNIKAKLAIAYQFMLDRAGESSTWQAIAFASTLFGSHASGVAWGDGAALGGLVSAFIKAVTKG